MHYVVGDVHGCYDDLMAMLNTIESKDKDAIIYFVGDFIDRGPKVWETLNWCLENITADGKYQSVLGNHEDLVMKWYYKNSNENAMIKNLEPCLYGFDAILIENDINYIQELKTIVDFWELLPLHKRVSVDRVNGVKQEYIIAHAFAPKNEEEIADKSDDEVRDIYLWSRQHFWGYYGDAILVHGHTPTVDHDYMLRGERKPGFINYRHNAINVDGGCVLFSTHFETSPCMLCAICLETLEEIYPYDWEKRMRSADYEGTNSLHFDDMTQNEINLLMKEHRIDSFKEVLNRVDGDVGDRKLLLERMGLF